MYLPYYVVRCINLVVAIVLGISAIAAAPAAAALAQRVTSGNLAPSAAIVPARRQNADFRSEPASAAARQVSDWVVASGDNRALAFVIVDKVNARLFLFDAGGTARTSVPVLVGLAHGDDSPRGIGDRKLSAITPAERITPAGRFVAEPGQNLSGKDILWVDYDAAISLHRASDKKPGMTAKSRVERLTGPTGERRISYGCINVAEDFYDQFIRPTFARATGIVYILPETRSARDEFHIPGTDVAQVATTGADAIADAGPAASM